MQNRTLKHGELGEHRTGQLLQHKFDWGNRITRQAVPFTGVRFHLSSGPPSGRRCWAYTVSKAKRHLDQPCVLSPDRQLNSGLRHLSGLRSVLEFGSISPAGSGSHSKRNRKGAAMCCRVSHGPSSPTHNYSNYSPSPEQCTDFLTGKQWMFLTSDLSTSQ